MKKLIYILIITSSVLFAQDYSNFGITAYGGSAYPSGNFDDFYNNGYGGAAGIMFDFKFSTRFALTVGYTRWEVDNAAVQQEYEKIGGEGTLNLDAPVRVIPVLLQARWFASRGGMNLYALVEFGFYFIKSEVSGSVTQDDTVVSQFSGKSSNTATGINLGLGLTFQVSSSVELDIAGRYHIVSSTNIYSFAPTGSSSILATDQYWSVMGGLNYLFN